VNTPQAGDSQSIRGQRDRGNSLNNTIGGYQSRPSTPDASRPRTPQASSEVTPWEFQDPKVSLAIALEIRESTQLSPLFPSNTHLLIMPISEIALLTLHRTRLQTLRMADAVHRSSTQPREARGRITSCT
jgi:hypothetical protein